MRIALTIRFSLAAMALSQVLTAGPIPEFVQHNLSSNIPGLADHTDPDLKNPWGISFAATSPFWISDNGSGLSTLYNGAGAKQGLIVTIPKPGGGTSAPTGTVFNGTGLFNADIFLFASEDGAIAGWRGALGTTAEILADNSPSGAVYKGLSLGSIGPNAYLYAADFANGQITVIPSAGAPALTGTFTDPALPAGFAPFNVQTIGTQVFVTYAKKLGTTSEDDPGPGNGFVDVFDLNGVFQGRVVSQGVLNSPWGLALAPAGFGDLGGDLLVGNFGDGTINAFSLSGTTGTFVGTVADISGTPLSNDGLWALKFGNGGPGFKATSLYLTAGLNDENDGLFASIENVPEPASLGMFAAGAALLIWRRKHTR